MIAGTLEIQLLADMARLRSDMDDAKRAVGGAMESIERSVGVAKNAFAGLVASFGIGELVKLTDQYTKFTAQLRLASTSTTQYAQAYRDVSRIAKDAQADLAATGTLYARIANGTRELGLAQSKVADITETVNLSLKVSGATGQESASAMLQLSQAFASGTLRGEEFNAVNEAAPRLMKALADGIGMPVGALKQMASDGKLTSSVLADALPRALGELRKEAAAVQTISGAFTVLKNNVLEFVGAQAQSSGAVSVVTRGIGVLADNLNVLAAAAAGFAATKLAELFAGIGVKLQAGVASTIEYVAAQNALRASTLATAEARVAETAATVAQIAAMEAEIPAMRAEVATKLASSSANIKAAEAAIVAATATGALSGALRVRQEAELSLVAAVEARSASAAKLAILDQQQIRLNTQAAAAAEANAAAQRTLAAAQGASGAAGGLASRALGLLGGPIGLITTLLGLGATAWMLWGSKSEQASQQAARAAENSLASVKESTEQIIASLDKQIEKYDLLLRAKNNATGIDNAKRYDSAYSQQEQLAKQLAALNAGTGEFARMSREEKLIETERIMSSIKKITDGISVAEQKRGAVETQTATERALKLRDEMKLKGEALAARLKEIDALAAQGVDEKTILDLRARAQETLGEKAKKAAAERAQGADQMLKTIREEIAAEQLQIGGQDKLTKSQQIQIQLDADMRIGKDKSLQVRRAEILAQIQMLALLEREAVARKEQKRVDDEHYGAVSSSTDQLDRQIETLQRENEVIGLTAAQIEVVEAARRADEIAIKRRALAQAESSDASASYIEALRIEIEQLQKVSDLKAQGAQARVIDEQAKKTAEEWKRLSNELGQGLTDSFFRAFESGKNFGRTFFDGLKNMAKTTLLRIPIQYVQNGILSAFGMGGTSGTGGDAISGISNLYGAYDKLKTGYGLVSGWLGGGSGAAATGSMFGGAGFLSGGMFGAGAGASIYGSGAAGVAYGANAGLSLYGTGTAMSLSGSTAGLSAAAGSAGASSAGLASGFSGTMASVPIAGWVAAGMAAADSLFSKGWDYQKVDVNKLGKVYGSATFAADRLLRSVGLSDRVANLLSGASTITAMFGRKKPEVQASGIEGTFTADGFSGQGFTDWKAKGGWFRSDKKWTDYSALDDQQSAMLGGAVKGSLGFYRNLDKLAGGAGLSDRLGSFSYGVRTDLREQSQVDQMLKDMANTMGRQLLPELERFQKQGESISDTAQRLTDVFSATNIAASVLGKTTERAFGGLGLSTAQVRQSLVDLAGGLEAFNSKVADYYAGYFSEEEKIGRLRERLNGSFRELGFVMPSTRRGFRDLVESMDLSTEEGQTLFDALMNLAPSFGQVADAATAAMEATKAFSDQVKAFQDGLKLGNLSTLTPEQQYAEAKRRYEETSSKALGGDADARSRWTQIAQAFLEASRAYYASGGKYAADFDLVNAFRPDGSHANGLAYVPFDGYHAELHEGEGILTRAENARRNETPNWLEYGRGSSGALVAEIKALRAEGQALRAEVQALRDDGRTQAVARMQQAEASHQEAVAVAGKQVRLLDEMANERKQ